ncbi:MAG: energy transducer TonB, partial [Sinobacteraceae bacterium]|nr:energy transducer TonB [Nevskiaceae bacterium]
EVSSTRTRAVAAESDRLEKLVRERLRDGHLADPAQDSAAFYLTQLQSNDPGNAAAGPLSHDLAARFVERARGEAQNNQAAAVDADLAQAKRWGADPKDMQAVTTLQTANTASAARQVSPAKLAATLKKTRNVSPEYPPRALADKVAGSVTVEFTVTTSGEPRDIRVVDSTPPGVFDRAALNAVRRWRWESPPVEIPMRTAIRFELPK